MRDLARIAIAAFARRQEGSGVIGVDVQRIRRALGLRAEPQPELPSGDPRRDGLPREALRRFEALLRRELERSQIERRQPAALARWRARPRAAVRPARRPGRRAPRRRAAAPAPGDAGATGPRTPPPCPCRREAHDARLAADRGGAGGAEVPPAPPAPPGDLRAVRRLHERTSASVFFRSVLHALHDTSARCAVRVHRCISEVTRHLRTGAQLQGGQRMDLKRRGAADISGYTTTAGGRAAEQAEDDPHPRATVIAPATPAPTAVTRGPRCSRTSPVPGARSWLNPSRGCINYATDGAAYERY